MDSRTRNEIYNGDLGVYTSKRIRGIPAFIIALQNDRVSMTGARKLITSIKNTNSFVDPFILPASTPETVKADLAQFDLTETHWTWPKNPGESRLDIKSGLQLHGYGAKDWRKVLACLVSHMRLWHYSAQINVPIMVLEHDAIFNKTFSEQNLAALVETSSITVTNEDSIGVIGLNDPRGATRKSGEYLDKVLEYTKNGDVKVPAPWIDNKYVPQGIAGNSAYIIGPKAARKLFSLIAEHGLWPNDAIMCKQLMGPTLHQAYPFYTGLQGISSTTQG